MTAMGVAARRPELADRIGRLVREGREREGLSQAKLAEQLGVDHSYVNRIEGGERTPGTELLITLARRYGWTLEDVTGVLP